MKRIFLSFICSTALLAMEQDQKSEILQNLLQKDNVEEVDNTIRLAREIDALEQAVQEYLQGVEHFIHQKRERKFEKSALKREKERKLQSGIDLRRLHEEIACYGDFLLANHMINEEIEVKIKKAN